MAVAYFTPPRHRDNHRFTVSLNTWPALGAPVRQLGGGTGGYKPCRLPRFLVGFSSPAGELQDGYPVHSKGYRSDLDPATRVETIALWCAPWRY
jgi:hypothetical protein